MELNRTVITKSAEETQELGASFAQQLHGGDVILLYGDLGSGKTTFMQGVAKGLGIEKHIISPTFVIVRTYEVRSKKKELSTKKLYHIDLYRTETIEDLKNIGIEEILIDKEAVIAIEWPEKLGNLVPERRIAIHIDYQSETERVIQIKTYR